MKPLSDTHPTLWKVLCEADWTEPPYDENYFSIDYKKEIQSCTVDKAEHERIVDVWMKHSNESYLKGERDVLHRVKEAIEKLEDAMMDGEFNTIDFGIQLRKELGLDEVRS